MAKGDVYTYGYQRVTEREKAIETVKKSHKLIEDKMKLVKEGKARLVKIPITNGFKLHFEMIE